MNKTDFLLKRVTLLIWACWSALVTLSNITDGLKSMGILPEWFKFVSGNFNYIQAATQIYMFPVWANAVLFIAVIIMEAVISILFFKSFINFSDSNPKLLTAPFLQGIILFGGFLVMDELFITYDRLGAIEQTHLGILIGMLVSLLAIRLLP